MKRVSERAALALLGLGAIVVVVFIALTMVSEQRRDAAVTALGEPEAVARHKKLADEKVVLQSGQPAQNAPVDQPPSQDRWAHYALVFERTRHNADRETVMRLLGLDNDGLETFCLERQDLIQEIIRVAELGGPIYRLDFSRGYWESLEAEYTILSDLDHCVNLLWLDARFKMRRGAFEEAADDLVAGMKLLDAIAENPRLHDQWWRREGYNQLFWQVQIFNLDALPPEQTERLVTHLGQAARRDAVTAAIQGELYSLLKANEAWKAKSYGSLVDNSGVYWGTREWLWKGPLCRPWFNTDESTLVDMTNQLAELSKQPYYQAKPEIDRISGEAETLSITRHQCRWRVPNMVTEIEAQAHHEAQIDLMRIGILVDQYHRQYGRCPESLDEIADALGGSVPVDPYTGEPFHYEVDGDAFLLYGVGANLVDDAGIPENFDDGTSQDSGDSDDDVEFSWPPNGDIVWRFEQWANRDVVAPEKPAE